MPTTTKNSVGRSSARWMEVPSLRIKTAPSSSPRAVSQSLGRRLGRKPNYSLRAMSQSSSRQGESFRELNNNAGSETRLVDRGDRRQLRYPEDGRSSFLVNRWDTKIASQDGNALLATRPDGTEAARWSLREVPAGEGYVAGLCVRRNR